MDWTKKQANEFYEWLNLNPLSVDVDLDFDYQKKFKTNSSMHLTKYLIKKLT